MNALKLPLRQKHFKISQRKNLVRNTPRITFDKQNRRQNLEGEHDIAYIPVQGGHTDDTPGLTAANMYLCMDPDDIDEEDVEEFEEYLEDAERDDN